MPPPGRHGGPVDSSRSAREGHKDMRRRTLGLRESESLCTMLCTCYVPAQERCEV